MRRAQLIHRIAWLLVAAVIVFALGRGIGWFYARSEYVAAQREFAERVEMLGGHAYYDYQLRETEESLLADDDGQDARPHWLATWIGKDWLHDIFYVSFARFQSMEGSSGLAAQRAEVTDEVLELATELPGLRWFALTGTGITDQGIARLSASPLPLERLWLSQTRITDAALEQLADRPSLTHLYLEGTPTSDRGVKALAQLPNLQVLSLGSPAITPTGLTHLGSTRGLREIYLDRLPVDNTVTAALAKHQRLEVVSLRGTGVTDGDLRVLRSLSGLRELYLDGNAVTGECFANSIASESLEILSMNSTRLSDNQLPHLEPYRSLKKLGVRETECSLSALIKLFVVQQQRSFADAFDTITEPQLDAADAILALDLQGINITEDDMDLLQELPKLQWLTLTGTGFSDAAAQRLSQQSLENLSLINANYTPLSDIGLKALLDVDSLRHLHVAGTRVSEQAAAKAQQQNPRLRVHTSDLKAEQRIIRAEQQSTDG